ncbi:MAG: hypothetical protein KDC71_17905 [Acidobacteria bacterium]|nr:hypothetical protein [Acidobacteriota bacterium]
MKDYMFLFIGGETPDASPEEMQAEMQKWFSWIGQMRERGIYVAGDPLEPQAKTVSGIDKVISDGPFAEAKEVVGGYIIIKASDIDSAAHEARNCPIFANGGRVEVRSVLDLGMN